MEKEFDVGVIVGRFQVPELTKAHKDIIEQVASRHKRVVIMIGVSPTLVTRSNPLDYLTRVSMIQSAFPTAIISHIADEKDDDSWSKTLDSSLRNLIPLGTLCLYGGRDSFISSYSGTCDTREISSMHYDEAGTLVRDEVRGTIIPSTEFRWGVIYASQNQYPKVYPTVDVAITRSAESGMRKVLLGRKDATSPKYSFIGGFVDPTDASYEAAALREVSEEVDVEIDRNLEYISSAMIDDWRYKSSEKIITTFYEAKLLFGSGTPKEEFYETFWFLIDEHLVTVISETHLPLVQDLIKKYNKI